MGHLDGKVAVVTGAGRGIGRSEALLLAAEGAAVVVNDLGSSTDGRGSDIGPASDVAAQIRAAGGRSTSDGNDISTWQGGEAVVRNAIDTFGRLDILVCNAGIARDRMVFNLEEDDWDAVIRVHVKGHVAPTRFASAYWREQAKASGASVDGRLVYTSSHIGLFGNSGQLAYGAAKAAIALLGISTATELARYGVTVNTICPGAKTRLVEALFPGEPPQEGFDPLSPDNIAPLVAYLCTEDAANISGQVFGINAGSVELLQGWTSAGTIDIGRRWTVDGLTERLPELFADRASGPPTALSDLYDLSDRSDSAR
jgi:NAD(P)-dependent dehydrogenase (short-subunit alcohol dehydrogenase family)